MWVFQHPPSGCSSLMEYRHSLPNPSTRMSFMTSSIATSLRPTSSLPFTNCPLPSNNGNLKDSSTTTAWGPSFLPLGLHNILTIQTIIIHYSYWHQFLRIFLVSSHEGRIVEAHVICSIQNETQLCRWIMLCMFYDDMSALTSAEIFMCICFKLIAISITTQSWV